jgi:hypothetical protein
VNFHELNQEENDIIARRLKRDGGGIRSRYQRLFRRIAATA